MVAVCGGSMTCSVRERWKEKGLLACAGQCYINHINCRVFPLVVFILLYVHSFHCKDYLVSRVRMEGLDPADVLVVDELQQILRREEVSALDKKLFQTAQQYRQELVQVCVYTARL